MTDFGGGRRRCPFTRPHCRCRQRLSARGGNVFVNVKDHPNWGLTQSYQGGVLSCGCNFSSDFGPLHAPCKRARDEDTQDHCEARV